MSEEHTQNLSDNRSFEERVFARFDALDLRLDRVDARLDAMDLRFDAMDLRFDAMDSRLDAVESRLQKLEIESERSSLETKPIWERALAQIAELQQGLSDFRVEVNDAFHDISRKFGVLAKDMMQLRADQTRIETRLDNVESKLSL